MADALGGVGDDQFASFWLVIRSKLHQPSFYGLQDVDVEPSAFRGVAYGQMLMKRLGRKVASSTIYFMVYDAIGG